MNPRPQTIALAALLLLTVALLAWLNVAPPRLDGQTLHGAELSVPMSRLRQDERLPLHVWLAVDCVFALVYTAFFTGGLRWLAARASRPWLVLVGRGLSWVAALAIVFDLAENAILWAAASTAAPNVSPWLGSLVRLKFLSTAVFVGYLLAWLALRWRPTRS
jgi:hypothetical protein